MYTWKHLLELVLYTLCFDILASKNEYSSLRGANQN